MPAKRFNPGFPLPLLSVFIDHMHGSYEDSGRSVRFGTDSVMTPASREQEIPGGQAAFLVCWP